MRVFVLFRFLSDIEWLKNVVAAIDGTWEKLISLNRQKMKRHFVILISCRKAIVYYYLVSRKMDVLSLYYRIQSSSGF